MSETPPARRSPSLRVEQALQLLGHAGIKPPAGRQGSSAWVQSLIDSLCELSSRDPLTGLGNRRTFELAMAGELDRVARVGEPALVLLVDIDRFKLVNDTHGHPAGDSVLQAVGKALAASVRPMDSVARLGGEEFGILLPNCPTPFGVTVAERVRRNVARTSIAIGPGKQISVSISVGGAFAPQWVRSSSAVWIERADRQLYRAKAEGRNRTCIEPQPMSEVSADEKNLLFGAAPARDAS